MMLASVTVPAALKCSRSASVSVLKDKLPTNTLEDMLMMVDGWGSWRTGGTGTDEGMRRKGSTRSRGRKPGSEKDLNVKGAKNKIREVLCPARTHTSHRPFSGCSQHSPHSYGA